MFKRYYGQCPKCEANTTRLIVTKNGLCQQHNQEKKNAIKPPKVLKSKIVKKKELRHGQCKLCPENTISTLEVAHYCRKHNDQKKKEGKEERSKRIVKLVNKAEKKKSVKKLKEELDAVFSLFIRHRGSKDGMNQCFTCGKTFLIKELQDGHYESRRFLSLRYSEVNNHPQCFDCNIRKKGNYTVYALKMMEKYGKEHLDMLAVKKHNVIHWDAFEYKLMIGEYTKKLNELKQKL